jgi:hydroxyacyl-ACP dehydratase HTD2-like protein with hotdog domain
MTQLYFDDIEVGQKIPELVITVDATQMFFFSAATYNGHRIHYDQRWAVDVEGYDDILIQGPLQAALLVRAVTDWIGDGGTLSSYAVQNRASAFVDEELHFGGMVTALREEGERSLAELELSGTRADGQLLMPGSAVVSLPRRA